VDAWARLSMWSPVVGGIVPAATFTAAGLGVVAWRRRRHR
jgi:hypothetical protein